MANQPTHPAQPELTSLWPVTLLQAKLDQHETINPQLISIFRQYQRENGNKMPFVSPDNFAVELQHPALDVLKKFIMDNVFYVAARLNGKYWGKKESIDINVTGFWFQISNNYSFHETHIHGNCSWSGVYYVDAGDSSKNKNDRLANGMPNGITRFYGPNMEYGAGGHSDKGNFYLQDSSFDSFPENGKLVVFPSHLKHMVFPYNGERDRIIVSFHAMVTSPDEKNFNYSFD